MLGLLFINFFVFQTGHWK